MLEMCSKAWVGNKRAILIFSEMDASHLKKLIHKSKWVFKSAEDMVDNQRNELREWLQSCPGPRLSNFFQIMSHTFVPDSLFTDLKILWCEQGPSENI